MITPATDFSFFLVQGGTPCRVPLAHALSSPQTPDSNSNPSSARAPHPRPWCSAVASFSTLLPRTTPPISNSPSSWLATATPSASGGSASSPKAWPVCKTPHAPAGPGAFPPDKRLAVVTLASSTTQEHQHPDSAWSLDELAFTLVNEVAQQALSRSTIQRI